MKPILKESVARKQRPFWQVIVLVIIAVFIINYLISLTNFLGEKYAGIVSIAILLISVAACSFIVTKFIEYYTYKIADDTLIFEKSIGKKSKVSLMIDIEDIEKLIPYGEMKEDSNIDYTYKFVCDKDYNNFYVGEFNREGKQIRFIFKPSDKFIDMLKKRRKIEG